MVLEGVGDQACNPGFLEGQDRKTAGQDLPGQWSKFKAGLANVVRLCLKMKTKKRPGNLT